MVWYFDQVKREVAPGLISPALATDLPRLFTTEQGNEMTLNIEFDTDGIESIQSLIRQGLTGYARDRLVPQGMSTIWLFLRDGSVLKIHTKMTDTVGWDEVGTLVFRRVAPGSDVPSMLPVPEAWRTVTTVEKLVVVDEHFSAEGGLQICNRLEEVFNIVCSANVYQIEISAPFFDGSFSPEYALTHYRRVSV